MSKSMIWKSHIAQDARQCVCVCVWKRRLPQFEIISFTRFACASVLHCCVCERLTNIGCCHSAIKNQKWQAVRAYPISILLTNSKHVEAINVCIRINTFADSLNFHSSGPYALALFFFFFAHDICCRISWPSSAARLHFIPLRLSPRDSLVLGKQNKKWSEEYYSCLYLLSDWESSFLFHSNWPFGNRCTHQFMIRIDQFFVCCCQIQFHRVHTCIHDCAFNILFSLYWIFLPKFVHYFFAFFGTLQTSILKSFLHSSRVLIRPLIECDFFFVLSLFTCNTERMYNNMLR